MKPNFKEGLEALSDQILPNLEAGTARLLMQLFLRRNEPMPGQLAWLRTVLPEPLLGNPALNHLRELNLVTVQRNYLKQVIGFTLTWAARDLIRCRLALLFYADPRRYAPGCKAAPLERDPFQFLAPDHPYLVTLREVGEHQLAEDTLKVLNQIPYE